MDFNSIQRIVEAEQNAEKVVENAKEEAKKIMQNLQGKEENTKLFYQTQLKRKVDEFSLSQNEEKKKKIDQIKSDAIQKSRTIKESSEKNMARAVDEIFKYVVLGM